MSVEMLHSIFYETVLKNSAVGAVFVLFILLFRKMSERMSKGFVRILWILLLVELLAPPLQRPGEIYFMEGMTQGAGAVLPAIWLAGVFCVCVIYLCRSFELRKKTADSVRADILSHEGQSIKNFDSLIKCLAAFALAVHWFNPLVWVAYVFMGKDSETAKKTRFDVAFLLVVIVGVSGISLLTAKKVEGKKDAGASGQDAETLLAEKIQECSGGPLLKKCFADFDGDGTGEMFAVTGVAGEAVTEGTSRIWYAGPEGVTCLMDDSEGYTALWQDEECIHTVNSSQKLFVVTCGTGGSTLFSKCYYVRSGKAYEVDTGAYLEQLDGEDFVIYPDAYDHLYMDDSWSGHTRKAYYLKWTGNGFEEYTAKEISMDELKKYDSSESILSRIKESDYEVTSIYLRSNGIININAAQDFDSGRNYENVTLKIEDGGVYVVSTDVTGSKLDARDILEVSSYGGIYKESGFPEGHPIDPESRNFGL